MERLAHLGTEVRLVSIAVGPITGFSAERVSAEAETREIGLEKETYSRIRRGDVGGPRSSTVLAIVRLTNYLGVAPTNEQFVSLVSETVELERQHAVALRRNDAMEANQIENRLFAKAYLYEKLTSNVDGSKGNEGFGRFWLAGSTLARAASVSFDGKAEANLKAHTGIDIAGAYTRAGEMAFALAWDIKNWPNWTSAKPGLIAKQLPSQHKAENEQQDDLGGLAARESRQQALRYGILMQNSAVALGNLHALGCVRNDEKLIADASAAIRQRFADHDLLLSSRFMGQICEGYDLHQKYKRNLALFYAVADDLRSFDKECSDFKRLFGFDPRICPVNVKGEAKYPPLCSDPSVQHLLGNKQN